MIIDGAALRLPIGQWDVWLKAHRDDLCDRDTQWLADWEQHDRIRKGSSELHRPYERHAHRLGWIQRQYRAEYEELGT